MEIKNVQANNLPTDYLNFCLSRKNLDQKTIKSYTIDLRQNYAFTMESANEWTNKKSIEQYIEFEELIDINPFHKIQIKY